MRTVKKRCLSNGAHGAPYARSNLQFDADTQACRSTGR
jgi:uncharacterized protein YuzB (UPF0349 family)